MKDKKRLLWILMALAVLSCNKYLEQKSNLKLTVPTTLADLQGLMDDAVTMNNSITPSFGESSADDYFLLETSYNNLGDILFQSMYKWKPSDYYNSANDWGYAYRAVYNANYALEQIDKTSRTSSNQEAWDNVKGSALFFRAYYFLNLAWIFAKAYDVNTASADLGIVLRTSSDFNEPSLRSSVADTYRQILQDAVSSVVLLPGLPRHVLRPSKAAAYGLLARTYLSMRRYDSAGKYADLSLQLKSDLMDYNGDAGVNALTASVPFILYDKETLFYTNMNGWSGLPRPSSALIDTFLYGEYADDDLRKTAFFATSGNYKKFKGNYTATANNLFTGIATDEMYLIRAECRARVGNKDGAVSDLNTLLAKRWKPGIFIPRTANSPEEALVLVLSERRKELLMRGLRWMDIKRLNKEGYDIVQKRKVGGGEYTLPPNDSYYALPLPTDVIELTGMQQN